MDDEKPVSNAEVQFGSNDRVDESTASNQGDDVAVARRVSDSRRALIRTIRGKYAHLRISVDEFMEEKRRDAANDD